MRRSSTRATRGAADTEFVRKGDIKGPRQPVPEAVLRRIEAEAGPLMRRLGYLDGVIGPPAAAETGGFGLPGWPLSAKRGAFGRCPLRLEAQDTALSRR